MKKYLLAIALAGTALGGAAIAGQMDGDTQRADTDKDGAISRVEFMAQSDRRFARLDANGDGQLSGDERKGRRGGRGGGIADADTSKDGKISKAEFAAQASARFATLDMNKDGKISAEEMKATMQRLREARGGPGGRGGPGMVPAPGAEGRMGHGGRMMALVDTDRDGKVSRAESRAQADARFDKLDANRDGFIDAAEMDAVRDRMKQHRGKMRGHGGHHPGGAAPTPDAGQ